MGEISKTTAAKLGYSSSVRMAIEVQGPGIAERAVSPEFAADGRPVDLASLVEGLGALLTHAEEALREADANYLAERTDDSAPREARDEHDANLRQAMIDAKSLVDGALGGRFARQVGLGAPLEHRPDLLLEQARNAARLLRVTTPPAARLGGATIDPHELARSLDALADPLSAALDAIERESREAERTMIRRDQAAEHWDRVYAGAAEILIGLATLAGEDGLADRIRPTARRRAGVPGEDAEGGEVPAVPAGEDARPTG